MTQKTQKDTEKTIILVEDDKATRHHLAQSIDAHPHLKVIRACSTLADGMQALAEQKPDVLVTDLGLPDGNGIKLIHQARKMGDDIEIMVITVFGDEHNVLTAIEAGAGSYLLKDGDTAYIGDAIMRLLAGESPISAAIARQLLKRYRANIKTSGTETSNPKKTTQLTDRETEVLSCMAKGYTYNEAADILGMSTHTVTSHIKKIYRKLEVNSRSEAVFEAVQQGLVNIQS